MRQNYYGLQITALPASDRWKWQVVLPFGVSIASNKYYPTPEQALAGGKRWIDTESAFNAINNCLSELCGRQLLSQQEYRKLMQSFVGITQRC